MGGNHAKLCPPSGWDRWSNCTISVDLQTGESSIYADEGTAAHFLADTAFKAKKKAADYVGRKIWVPSPAGYKKGQRERFLLDVENDPSEGNTFEVDFAMADPVQEYMDQVLVQDRDYLQFETKVPIGHVTGEEGATGTCDALRAIGVTLASHDLKFGQGKRVFAKNNGQQLLYLLGGLEELDWFGEFEHFEVHIHQPRLGHHDVWELTRDELEEWRAKISEKAHRVTIEGVREYGPSKDGCMFCDNRIPCEARTKFIQDGIADGFPLLEDEVGDLGLEEENAKMLVDLEYVEMVEKWCKDQWAKAYDIVKADPDALPGWGLFPGRGSQNYKDEALAEKRLKGMRFKLDEYKPRKLVSPAQAKKLMGKERYTRFAKDMVDWKEGKPTFGRDTGKRKKVDTAEAMGFSDLDQEEK